MLVACLAWVNFLMATVRGCGTAVGKVTGGLRVNERTSGNVGVRTTTLPRVE